MFFDGVIFDRIFSIGFFYIYMGSFLLCLGFWIVRFFFHISFGCLFNRFLVWLYSLLPYRWLRRHAFPFVVLPRSLTTLQCCVSLREDFIHLLCLQVI